MKLDESTRQSWLVAGGTIQSFDKVSITVINALWQDFLCKFFFQFGNGTLQETPVKITKTVTPDKPQIRPSPQIIKRPIQQQQQVRSNVVITENRIIKRADDTHR